MSGDRSLRNHNSVLFSRSPAKMISGHFQDSSFRLVGACVFVPFLEDFLLVGGCFFSLILVRFLGALSATRNRSVFLRGLQ